MTPVDVDDENKICGELPTDKGYVVCNHKTGLWQEFTIIKATDFTICGEKPNNMGFAFCNHNSEKWEEVGVVHAPGESVCGVKPVDMIDPICDAVSGVWIESTVLAVPNFKTCSGPPPKDLKFAVCNVETGEWDDAQVVMDDAALEVAV